MRTCRTCGTENPRDNLYCAHCGARLSGSLDIEQMEHGIETGKGRFLGVDMGLVLNDRYEIGEKLGRGRMGIVYSATDLRNDSHVAVKVLSPELDRIPHAVRRVRHEATAAMGIRHPGVIDLMDYEESGGYRYLVMEYIEGRNFRQVIGLLPEGRIDVVSFLKFSGTICDALDHCHEAGVVHSDMCPENIMLTSEDEARITSFGIPQDVKEAVTLLCSESRMPFVAPELYWATCSAPETDQYAAACTFYEMLSGRSPLENAPEPPPPLDNVPSEINAAIMRGMSEEAGDRWGSMRQFHDGLMGKIPVDTLRKAGISPLVKRILAGVGAAAIVILAMIGLHSLIAGGDSARVSTVNMDEPVPAVLAESTKVIPVVPQEVAKPEAPPVPPPESPMPVRAKPAQSSPAVTGDRPLGTIFTGFDTRADLTRFRKNRYGTFRVVNGKLSVTARPGHMATLTLENVEFHDGAVEVKTRHVSGAKRSAFGLEIRGNTTPDGRTHYYRFDTNGNVSYSIRKKTGRSSVALKGWSWIPRKDRREENTLRIECRGSMLRFLLNGITVGVFDDEAIRSGWIALYANAGMVVEFDDLRVEPSGG